MSATLVFDVISALVKWGGLRKRSWLRCRRPWSTSDSGRRRGSRRLTKNWLNGPASNRVVGQAAGLDDGAPSESNRVRLGALVGPNPKAAAGGCQGQSHEPSRLAIQGLARPGVLARAPISGRRRRRRRAACSRTMVYPVTANPASAHVDLDRGALRHRTQQRARLLSAHRSALSNGFSNLQAGSSRGLSRPAIGQLERRGDARSGCSRRLRHNRGRPD